MTTRPYILQRRGTYCTLVSMCNALRYYGKDSPEPGNEEWAYLVKLIGAEHGAAIWPMLACEPLGITRTPINVNEIAKGITGPVEISVWNPDVGCAMHSTLVIEVTDTHWTLVNYRWKNGPVVENVQVEDLAAILPDEGNINRRAWAIRLAGEHNQ